MCTYTYIHCMEYGTVSCQYQAAIRKPRRFCYSLVHARHVTKTAGIHRARQSNGLCWLVGSKRLKGKDNKTRLLVTSAES
ncbi:hypothetical protein J3E68DRAFT_288131 [Trichoderma sp. SZMC 28012]